ncbi:hypothetical protein Kim5_CH00425 [Rhizobium sp. Kim5]|nr:hypothetical protein Kim5_CH00425 [Rhizobium sp. Kim5]
MVVCGYQFTPSLRFIQALRAISSKIGVGLRALGALGMMGITSKGAHGVDCGGLLARAYQKVNRAENRLRRCAGNVRRIPCRQAPHADHRLGGFQRFALKLCRLTGNIMAVITAGRLASTAAPHPNPPGSRPRLDPVGGGRRSLRVTIELSKR